MRIRSYDQQYQAQGQIGGQASPDAFGGQIGAAEENAGQNLDRASGVLTDMYDAKDQLWRNNAVSAYQLQQFQNLQTAKTDPDFANKYGADGGKFTDSFSEQLSTASNALIATPGLSPKSQRELQMQLNQVNTSLTGHAIQFQAETGGAYAKDQLQQSMENDAKMVANSPGDTSMVLDRGKLNIANTPYLQPDQKSELLRSYEQNIALSAGKGMVLHSPEKVLAAIAPDVLATFKPTPRVVANTSIPVTGFAPAKVSAGVMQYSPLITQSATTHNIDPNFLHAQLDQESHGDPNAVNNNDIKVTGEPSVGIAQFQPGTAAQYGVVDPTKPEQAIPGAAAYDSDLLKQFGGDYRKVAAAYNWGPGNLQNAIAQYGDKWADHIPASTTAYINKIFAAAPPVATAESALAMTQQQATEGEPSRADTNPDWFNKLNWQQQFEIVHEAEQGVRANQVRDSQTLSLQKQQREAAQQQTMNGMFNRIGAQQNPLTVAEIRQSDLDYQGKEHMLSAINQANRGDTATDPAVFDSIFNRIHAPDGDPTKIADDRALLPYMGHGLSFDDLNKLRGELKGRNTPEGSTQSDLKKNLFSMARKQIDTSIFGVSVDTQGAQNFYKFQQAALSYIDTKTRAGANVLDLYNPDSKDYVGKLIPLYTRTPQQQQEDVAKAMGMSGSKPVATPRQPGESPADYLKRTGTMQ